MLIQPSSVVTLYENVYITNDERLVFSSAANRNAYLNAHLLAQTVNCTMIKKTGRLRLEISGAIASRANYMSFINPDFDNKAIFCFVDDYFYINNECVEIAYSIDPFMTWMFDFTMHSCYILREHVSQMDKSKLDTNAYDQSVYEMRTPENLAVGEDLEKPLYKISWVDQTLGATYDGVKLFNWSASGAQSDPSMRDVDQLYDVIFHTSINFDDLDSDIDDHYVLSDAYNAYLEDVLTQDDYKTWLQNHSSEYQVEIPSTAYKNFLNDYALAYRLSNSDAWKYRSSIAGSFATAYSNSTLAFPYNCIIVAREYSDTLINYLTQWGCVSTIMGIYSIPRSIVNRIFTGQGMYDITVATAQARMNNSEMPHVTSHKLLNFPYSYLSVSTPNGDTKEYKYEHFASVVGGYGQLVFGLTVDMNQQPTLILAPKDYMLNINTASPTAYELYNLVESVTYSGIPQIPYNTDGFMEQMANVANEQIGKNTKDYAYQSMQGQSAAYSGFLGRFGDVVDSVTGVMAKVAGGGLPGISSIAGAVANGFDAAGELMQIKRAELDTQQMTAAYGLKAGQKEGNVMFDNYLKTRSKYAASVYHAGTRNGILNYLYGISDMYLTLIFRRLNDQILAKYDEYFMNYGYTSNRNGIARVYNFIKGSQDPTKLPSWVTIDNVEKTFIQTQNCTVTGVMKPVADAIEEMFNRGIRLVNGNPSNNNNNNNNNQGGNNG